MKVLSGPIDGSRHANAYIRQLLAGLDSAVTLSEFTWRRAIVSRHDVIHLHWVEHMLDNTGTGRRAWPKLGVLGAVVALAKLRRTKLVWTVHNETPHERPRLPVRLGLGLWSSAVDGAVFLTESARAGRFPTEVVIRHGDYLASIDDACRTPVHHQTRPYVLAFGQLRAYKGLDRLVSEAVASAGEYDVVIAGPDQRGTQAPLLRSLAGSSERVRIDDRFVPDDELVALLRGSRGVVLPYRRMSSSGALLFALSAGVRSLVPDTPSNREIAALVGDGWVVPFAGDLTADALDAFAASPPPSGHPDLSAFAWDTVIAEHVALYRTLSS